MHACECIQKSLRIRLRGCRKYHVDTADSYDKIACFRTRKGELDKAMEYHNNSSNNVTKIECL